MLVLEAVFQCMIKNIIFQKVYHHAQGCLLNGMEFGYSLITCERQLDLQHVVVTPLKNLLPMQKQ